MGGVETRYTLDIVGRLPERLGSATNGTSTWYIRGWGQELSKESGGTTSAWYLSDRLGSVRGLASITGTLTTSYNYDPFGTPQGTSLPSDYGYTGEPHDSGSGLVHLRARWYGTGAGRFLTQDPFSGWSAQPQSLHRYMYGNDDPVNITDPTGLYGQCGCELRTDKIEDDLCTLAGIFCRPSSNQPDFWERQRRGWTELWETLTHPFKGATTTTRPNVRPQPVPEVPKVGPNTNTKPLPPVPGKDTGWKPERNRKVVRLYLTNMDSPRAGQRSYFWHPTVSVVRRK